jgi:hypothetical protein
VILLEFIEAQDIWNLLREYNLGSYYLETNLPDIGFSLFEIITVLGVSFLITVIPWKSLSRRASNISDDEKIFKSLFILIIDYVSLTFFELAIFLTDLVFNLFIGNIQLSWFQDVDLNITIERSMQLLLTNLFLVLIFNTIIAFQAIRMKLSSEDLVKRFFTDYCQGILLLFEGIALLIPYRPFYPDQILRTLIDFQSMLLILLISVTIYRYFNVLIEGSQEEGKTEISFRLFVLQILRIFTPLAFLTIVFPFFIQSIPFPGLQNVLIMNILLLGFSIGIVGLYILIGPHKLMVSIIRGKTIENIRYQFSSTIASRGILFSYPIPINPFEDLKHEPINSFEGKIKLKIACGNCFHVFKVKFNSKADQTRSFPCPFCNSLSTTPVWER